MSPSGAPEPDAAAATRPASLWPETTRPADLASTGFSTTHFDPLAELRAQQQVQARASLDVCHPALALRAVLLVQFALALVALGVADGVGDWAARQAALAFAGLVGTLLWLGAVCALRLQLQGAGLASRAAALLALGAAASLLAGLPLWWAGLAPVAGGLRVAAAAGAGVVFAALLWAWLDLRARIWQPAGEGARPAEPRVPLRPQFFIDALNTARALVRRDPERAESVLEDLTQLLRAALADAPASVRLREEIDLARRYLAIEQVRFGARMAVQWEIDPRVGDARVPAGVLQSLLQDAVRHGIEPAARDGRVIVRAQGLRGQVAVVVSHTPGDDPDSPAQGTAVHEVGERLRLLHGAAAQCDAWREGLLFHARIVLPAA